MSGPTQPQPPIRYGEIHFGDDLRAVALREMGDAARWLDLVVLNGLRPPYIAARADAGVLAYGDVIRLPAGASTINPAASPREVFSADVQVDADRQLVVVGGDLALVAGVPNLNQALCHRVKADKRELAFHPEYGCYVRRLVGTVNSPARAQLAALYVRSSLLEDDRVDEVLRCTAEGAGDQLRVKALVRPVTGRPTELEVLI